ncbi:Os03g0395100, partial [Oryza sativa Japonica Group]
KHDNSRLVLNSLCFPLHTFQIGPLRCWPGGLCLSRSIGDIDVGEFIVPVPHVKQVKVCDLYIPVPATVVEKIMPCYLCNS